jgi:hypothetical protein
MVFLQTELDRAQQLHHETVASGEAKSKEGAFPYNESMKTEVEKLKRADPKLTHKYAPSVVPLLVFCWAPRGPTPSRTRSRAAAPGLVRGAPRGVRIRGTVSSTRVRSLQRRRRLTCSHVPSAGRRPGRPPPPGSAFARLPRQRRVSMMQSARILARATKSSSRWNTYTRARSLTCE